MGRSSRISIFLSISLLLPAVAGGSAEASGRPAFYRGLPGAHPVRHRGSEEGVAALLMTGSTGESQAGPPPAPRLVRYARPAFIQPCVRPLILRIGHQPVRHSETRVVYGTPACAY